MISTNRFAVVRAVAGAVGLLAAWAALDSLITGVLGAGAAGGRAFFLHWGVPLAVAAAFLGWYSARAGRAHVRVVARHGCLGAIVLGGLVLVIMLVSPLVGGGDALRGAVTAVLYAPLAASVGLLIGLAWGWLRSPPS